MAEGVVDPGKKPNKRQSNPESSSPGLDDKVLVAPFVLDIGSIDKEITDSFDNSTAHVEGHNTSKVSSKQVSAENNWPEWSLPPPQRTITVDNMDLPVPEGSSSSTSAILSGQKDIVKQSLMTEQDSNIPLAREDGHANNAAAIVTGRPPLQIPPVRVVAFNNDTKEMTIQQSKLLYLQMELKEIISWLQQCEASLSQENEMRQLKETNLIQEVKELKLENNHLMEELNSCRQRINCLNKFVKSVGDNCHQLLQEQKAVSFGRDKQGVPNNAVESQNEEKWPFAHGAKSTTMKVQPASIEVDKTDVMLMELAVLVASRSELSTEGKPSVGCIIYRHGDPVLPNLLSLGWNGFVKNKDKIDLRVSGESDKKKKLQFRYCCLHAETKAILFPDRSLKNAIVYVTHMPCSSCAKLLCEAGVRLVFYLFSKKDSTIEPFKLNKTTSCICFPRRDQILQDFDLKKLKQWGITLGDTDTNSKPEDCESYYLGTEDHN